jgi:hypothetical protein
MLIEGRDAQVQGGALSPALSNPGGGSMLGDIPIDGLDEHGRHLETLRLGCSLEAAVKLRWDI